jgi:hypothetical protein
MACYQARLKSWKEKTVKWFSLPTGLILKTVYLSACREYKHKPLQNRCTNTISIVLFQWSFFFLKECLLKCVLKIPFLGVSHP